MKKILASAVILTAVVTTGITGYAASSRGSQFVRPCVSWCQDTVRDGCAGSSLCDVAAIAGKRMLSYTKSSAMEKKAFIASTAKKDDMTSAKADTKASQSEDTTASKTDTKAETASAAANTAPVQTDTSAAQAVAAPVENAVVSTTVDTTVVADQALCPHGYCMGQGLCPYSDCPNGGYCANNGGYQYQDNWNNGATANGGGDTYVDDTYYGGQTTDYNSYQADQGYGYQGGCGQGYGQGSGYGHHHGGHGHH